MTSKTHDTNVATQFGPRAAAYVASAIHAAGEDLQEIAILAEQRRPRRALDLGCGGGHVSYHVAPHAAEVVAFDLSQDMLDVVTQEAGLRVLTNIKTRQGNVEDLPFADGTFDFVASRFSAHHWHDLGAGLREARRVLAKGGTAIFSDTISPGSALLDTHLQAIELLRDPSHVRDYSAAEWLSALEAAGFTAQKTKPRRLRLEFSTWIARMATADTHVRAIRALQTTMPRDVTEHFELEADGSFSLDAMIVEAR